MKWKALMGEKRKKATLEIRDGSIHTMPQN